MIELVDFEKVEIKYQPLVETNKFYKENLKNVVEKGDKNIKKLHLKDIFQINNKDYKCS